MKRLSSLFIISHLFLTVFLFLPDFVFSYQERIVGGETVTDPSKYPWIAAIVYSDIEDINTAQFCGGTLINPEWVVTAAHCVCDSPYDITRAYEINVVLGTVDLNAEPDAYERIEVAEVIVHPDYDSFMTDNDIALLKLKSPSNQPPIDSIASTDNDPSLNLSSSSDTPIMATVMGWGDTQAQRSNYPSKLQEVSVPLVSNELCSIYFQDGEITENMLCAGFVEGKKDACSGDSGGPLVVSTQNSGYNLVGIVSWGNGCAQPDSYGVYTRVSKMRDWIYAQIEDSDFKEHTKEQMQAVAYHINNMLDTIPDMLDSDDTEEDVVNMLDSFGNLTGAGLIAAIAGGEDGEITPSKMVDSIGEAADRVLSGSTDTIITLSNSCRVINSTSSIFEHVINVIKENSRDQAVMSNVLDQLQIELGQIVDQINLNTEKELSRADSLKLLDDLNFLNDLKLFAGSISNLTTHIIKNKKPLTSELVGKMQRLSSTIYAHLYSRSDIEAFINSSSDYPNYHELLNQIIDTASIDLTSGLLITKEDNASILANNQSLTIKERELLSNGLPELPSFNQYIIKSGKTELSLVDILRSEIKALLPDIEVNAAFENQIQLAVTLKNRSIGLNIPVYIQDAHIVSELIPHGLYLMPEGTFILISSGIAASIAPAPLNSLDTLLSADNLLKIGAVFGSTKREIDQIKISSLGVLNIQFSDGAIFSGGWEYGVSKAEDINLDANIDLNEEIRLEQDTDLDEEISDTKKINFELAGTDPASSNYWLIVEYKDGSTQRLSPIVSAFEPLVQILQRIDSKNYNFDRSSGTFNVLGKSFKSAYLTEPVTFSEYEWFKLNKDNVGVAWQVYDYNGDTYSDLLMLSGKGKQIVYLQN